MASFTISRGSSKSNISLKYASAATAGIALGPKSDDDESASLAGATTFLGFLSRDVTVAGPTTVNLLLGDSRTNLDMPFKAGSEVTIERADMVDVAGSTFMATGADTGALTSSTAVGTGLGLNSGKWRVAQSGDDVVGKVVGHLGNDADGDFIVRIEVVRG